ncbi:MAG: hypothetical protein U5L96_15330 [Owenweeksia sp.]|nr:hypothetical protein [Owenweeksia sp.]
MSDSFRNWRGMQSMGVRRIKRFINIDLNSVRFVSPAMQDNFKKFQRVSGQMKTRQVEIDQFNSETGADTSEMINGRQMTNLGIFRKYITNYLMDHPGVAKEQTVMVRQLQSTEKGVPVEVYCVSDDIVWPSLRSHPVRYI